MQPHLAPIHELNTLEGEEFVAALRPLFEAADPLGRVLLLKRPFASYAQLLVRAQWLVQTLPLAEQIEVVNAHPRIGERTESVSTLSLREQGSHPDEPEEVYTRLAELNRAYEERFGFRFVVFVNGRSKSVIADILEQRLSNAPGDELHSALEDLFLIARDRLRLLAPVH